MQFLYTGAQSFQAAQPDPTASLGGFISGTVVPNNALNNIFSDISYQTAKRKTVEVRGLILKNVLGVDATDVVFGYQYPVGANFIIEVAFVTINSINPQAIEQIPNSGASPYTGVFTQANIDPTIPVDNSVDIGALANGASIALWLRRTMTGIFTSPTFVDTPTEMAYWQGLSDPSLNQTALTNIILKYTTA